MIRKFKCWLFGKYIDESHDAFSYLSQRLMESEALRLKENREWDSKYRKIRDKLAEFGVYE